VSSKPGAGQFSFDCGKNDCLAPNALMKYVSEAYISPYAIQGNKICTASTRSVSAILNLPPTGKAQYKFKRLGEKAPVLFFIGNTKDANCPDTRANLDTDNVWVLNELSPTIFVVSYYFPVLIILLVLTAGFLIWILFKNQEPAGSMLTGNTRHQAAEGEHKNST
jgi:hypothetical protein